MRLNFCTWWTPAFSSRDLNNQKKKDVNNVVALMTLSKASCMLKSFSHACAVWVTPVSPPLGPSVLEPGLDLRVRHLQTLGEGRALRTGQIFLSVEAFLQLADLHARERRAGLFPFGGSSVLIRVTDPPGHGERNESCRTAGKVTFRMLFSFRFVLKTNSDNAIINVDYY